MVHFGAEVSGFSSGAALVVAGIAGVGMAIGESVKKAGDFQASMTRLQTSAGELGKNIAMVSAGILKMSVETGTSTEQLAKGMYFVESAGNHGAAALSVLSVAAKGAKSENADLDVVARALTTTMTAYHMPVSQASNAMNGLIVTVQNGKTTLQELSASMGRVLPIASAMGISFPQVAGAIDTMTNAGMSSNIAATNLAHVLVALQSPSGIAVNSMNAVGLSAQQVKDTLVNKGLPQALQLIEDHVGKKFPAGSVENVTALKNIMGGLVGLKLAAMLTGDSLKTTEQNIAKLNAAMKGGSGAVLGWEEVQKTFNFQMDQAHQAVNALQIGIGTLLLPVLGRILGAITPVISGFANWVSSGHAVNDVLLFFHQHAQVIIPILAGLGAIVAAILVPAFASLAVSVVVATWPFLLIGAAVAGLVAIFMHFYSTSAPFKAFIDNLVKGFQQLWAIITANFIPAMQQIGIVIQTYVLPFLQSVGTFLMSTFKPVWDQLVATIRGQLIPIWNNLVVAIQPLMPTLMTLGKIIGGIVVTAIILLISILGGLIKGFAGFLTGLIAAFAGVVQIVSGAIKIVTGIITFFVDLVTGNFSKLGQDIGTIFDGIGTVITGFWNTIKGVFQAGVGAVVGFVTGFWTTIVGIFTNLANAIVGHSIVPDMINAIVQFFAGLPGRAVSAVIGILSAIGSVFLNLAAQSTAKVQQLITGVVNFFAQAPGRAAGALAPILGQVLGILGGVAGAALNAGANIVNAIANGIRGAIGAVGSAISDVGAFISSHLPHSPAKVGPLRDLVKQGSLIPEQIAEGMNNSSILSDSMNHLLTPIGGSLNGSGGGSGNGSVTINLMVDGRQLAQALGPHFAQEIRLVTGVVK